MPILRLMLVCLLVCVGCVQKHETVRYVAPDGRIVCVSRDESFYQEAVSVLTSGTIDDIKRLSDRPRDTLAPLNQESPRLCEKDRKFSRVVSVDLPPQSRKDVFAGVNAYFDDSGHIAVVELYAVPKTL